MESKDSKHAFLMRLSKLWFLRWPLKCARYLDFKGMRFREDQIWHVSTLESSISYSSTLRLSPGHQESPDVGRI